MSEYIMDRQYDIANGTFSTVKREEIVRCRDCKYAQDATWPARLNIPSDYLDCLGELVEPWDYYNDQPKMNPVKPDGFCAWGELMDGVA